MLGIGEIWYFRGERVFSQNDHCIMKIDEQLWFPKVWADNQIHKMLGVAGVRFMGIGTLQIM